MNNGIFSQVEFDAVVAELGIDEKQPFIERGEGGVFVPIDECPFIPEEPIAEPSPAQAVKPVPMNIAQMIEDELNKMLKVGDKVRFLDLRDSSEVQEGDVLDIALAREEDTGFGESSIFYLVRTKGKLHVVTSKALVLGKSDKLGLLDGFSVADKANLHVVGSLLQSQGLSYISLTSTTFGLKGGPFESARKRLWGRFAKLKEYYKLQAKQIKARR